MWRQGLKEVKLLKFRPWDMVQLIQCQVHSLETWSSWYSARSIVRVMLVRLLSHQNLSSLFEYVCSPFFWEIQFWVPGWFLSWTCTHMTCNMVCSVSDSHSEIRSSNLSWVVEQCESSVSKNVVRLLFWTFVSGTPSLGTSLWLISRHPLIFCSKF